jgi:hypothetical protein
VGAEGVPSIPRRRGRKPRVPLTDLLAALTFHVMQGAGTLSEHFAELFGAHFADSSWADRRARVPWEVFAELMRRALRPLATPETDGEAFWRGWRVLALDGTQFSVSNTPAIRRRVVKARTRRGRAAFAKLTTTVLLEVGSHNPLAAAIGRAGDSEWALARQLLAHVPPGALVLADRLYGCAAFVAPLRAACDRVGSHFLVRARPDVQIGVVERLADGSRLIGVAVRDAARPRQILDWLQLREIRVHVGRAGHRPSVLRVWTDLLNPQDAPALELAQLYARRWEHELYFREVKRQLRKTDLLQSHTLETAAQEIAALILASALLAAERTRAAEGDVPVLRLKFGRVLHVAQAMWFTVALSADVLTDEQIQTILTRAYERMRQYVTRPRRSRTCPRAVRQPLKAWPRLMRAQSIEGPLEFHLV